MPVARIITRHASRESEALKALSEQLRTAGYQVEVAPPGAEKAAADLVVELDEVSAAEALESAARMAREADTDVYIAPGLFTQPAMRSNPERSKTSSAPDVQTNRERGGVVGSTLKELGVALADGRAGIRDAALRVRARGAHAWAKWQQQRAEAAQALRLARERRELELEERRRQHEAELQRRAEEHQQLLAERERVAAEQERVLREQMARDAALRAERERVEREAMAREAVRRSEIAHAEEQERRRLAALQAERVRAQREQEAQRAAVLAAERVRLQREEAERARLQREQAAALASERHQPEPPRPVEIPAPPAPAEISAPAPEPIYADAAPMLRPRLIQRRRHIPTARERQWQRAAFLASVATLAAMLGFVLAANMRPSSPLPASLIQSGVQQQVPFGPAKAVPAATRAPAPARPAAPVKAAAPKPSPAKPAQQRRARRASRESDFVAEDEVIVRHHQPAVPAKPAQTTAAVRRITDEN